MRVVSAVALSAAALALAAGLAGAAAPPPRAPSSPTPQHESGRELAWGSFTRRADAAARRRLPDGDVISVSVAHTPELPPAQKLVSWAARETGGGEDDRIPRDRVEVVLAAGPGVTLWKGITAFGGAPDRPARGGEHWARLAQVGTEGLDRGPKRMLLAAADLRGGLKLSFEKANALGARAPVYTFDVPNVSRAGGHRITFTWEKDD